VDGRNISAYKKGGKMKYCRAVVLIVGATIAFYPAISFAQMTWTCVTDWTEWSPRSSHASVVFDGKMWVLGGALYDNLDSVSNDIWNSTNGEVWTQVTDSAEWSPRFGHHVVVRDDTMWLTGGSVDWSSPGTVKNDVWFSTDGANWTCAVDSAPWPGRCDHRVVVFNGEFYLTAGLGGWYDWFSDVWRSSDGVNWTCQCSAPPWQERCAHGLVVYNDTMWIVAGRNADFLCDIWCSTNGTDWTEVTNAAHFPARRGHTTIIFDNKMWVIGGASDIYFSDAWYSSDGAGWTCADSSAAWEARAWHTSVVYNNEMWVMGGSIATPGGVHDVWSSPGLGVEEQPIAEPIENGNIIITTIFRGPLQLPKDKNCRVFNITGRVVEPDRVQPGIYYIEVDGMVTQKVVKVR
jgi:hypothetical protein